ncbi:hypothetical protein MKW92_027780 [Papaver armeniacum]|nr:hypothetical protein MKW92_027780 [Papaver armeniacum]
MARNFVSFFTTVFFFAMIIMASITAQVASGAPHKPSVGILEDIGVKVEFGNGGAGGGGKREDPEPEIDYY